MHASVQPARPSAPPALVSLLIAFSAGAQWETWLYFLNGTPFGQRDPILGRDIGFYVFTLPLLEARSRACSSLLTLLTAAATLGVYLFGEEVGLEPTRGLFVSRRATRHLALLAALLFVVLGVRRVAADPAAAHVDVRGT